MAPGIVQIKRTGSITHQVDGLRESLSLEYTVEVDSKTVALADIDNVTTAAWGWGGANPLPEPYVTYLSGSRGIIVCKTCRLTRKLEEPKHWRYAVEFNNEPLSQQEQEKLDEPVPILRPARVTRSSQMIAVPVERDLDNTPLVNTAGQKPIDPLMLEAVHETLQVETYQPAWPIFYNTLSQKRSINSTSVVIKGQTFPAKSLWFWPAGIDAGTTENGTFFYTVRYDFVVRLETWTKHVERLSNGYEQLIE
ncbi:MAG: hypothetical protein IT565_14275, partial [Rhodospirillales bacterium]|nr:hypothetical protein [Rhodospirillales bacterium]